MDDMTAIRATVDEHGRIINEHGDQIAGLSLVVLGDGSKRVRGLLAHRKAGRWGNTQENVFILLALDKYFATYEAQTPEFVARVWLGDQYVAEFNHSGRTTEYQTTDVPMSYLAQSAEEQSLILSK